ncbi:hypothetical protein CJD36_018785 [Flavipsychrobacter stenotrophus]|uniref:Uncharacterized protein n=1 Tax=Flavipsychrobacter stenotrophus TaxID=2077091 RepID=A0A2S7SRW7_9BACT|nr:hypothetical protein [Flavipsychrobacter stenotrophus]PQJ09296.1 hypothetical protein CJD36_018785 [Flavipsychrobacter stenotrophus]
MNALQHTARFIIKRSFRLSVWMIEQFSDTKLCTLKVARLRGLPEGTLGKDIADCLEDNKLSLVPKYESHDLKHVLLNFKMTPVDEIRMQAFMIGNGNYSIPSFVIFLFGAFLLPELSVTFYRDFLRGSKCMPISSWSIEEYAHCDITALRNLVFNYVPSTTKAHFMTSFLKASSYTAIIAGIASMLYCLPFLFSSNVSDLVGAGFPFVGGAIIATGGLITLSNLKASQVVEVN